MSISAMTRVYESGLKRSLKAIALAYADHAYDDGSHIYPSVEYTAWKTGYSRRAVQDLTQELVNMKVLAYVGPGPNGTNHYRMNFSKLPARKPYKAARGGVQNLHPPEESQGAEGGAEFAPPGVQNLHGGVQKTAEGGAESAPKPSLNHQDKEESAESLLPVSPVSLELPPTPVGSILAWIGFAGVNETPLTVQTALAWAFYLQINRERLEKQGKNPVSIVATSWSKPGSIVPMDCAELAATWLGMTPDQRADLLQAVGSPLFGDRSPLPESLWPFTIPKRTIAQLYKATDGRIAPPFLMPPDREEPVDEPLVEPEPVRLTVPQAGGTAKTVTPDDASARIWRCALNELELQMTKATFNTWLKGSQLHLNGDNTAVVLVRNEQAAQWINGRLQETIARTLRSVADRSELRVEARVLGVE